MAERKQTKKILLLGLENSGKTTIVYSLKRDTNLLSLISLRPTRGVAIENIEGTDDNIAIWDMGGQQKYQKEYLSDFYKYTKGIDKVIFVIDVQDSQKYERALVYLQKIMNLLEQERVIVGISVFLHKYDPNLSGMLNFKNINDDVNIKLIEPISEIIPPNYEYKIFKTTIFTVFEKDLLIKRDKK